MTGEFDSICTEKGRGLIEIGLVFKRLPSESAKLREIHQSVWSNFWRQFGSNIFEYNSANLPLETTCWWFRHYEHSFNTNKICKKIKYQEGAGNSLRIDCETQPYGRGRNEVGCFLARIRWSAFSSVAAGAQFWLVTAIQLVADLATFMSRILFHAPLIAWHQATYTCRQTNC